MTTAAVAANGTKIARVLIANILADASTQARVLIDPAIVGEYAERMELGEPFPPLVVFRDSESPEYMWLADGFHRLKAAQKVGFLDIECEIHRSEHAHRDAILYAAGANEKHGLRRTPADRRRSIDMVITVMQAEGANWSNREIARQAAVGDHLVAEVRNQLRDNATEPRTGKDGKTYDMAKRAAANDARRNAREGKPGNHSPNGHEVPLGADNEGSTGIPPTEPVERTPDPHADENRPTIERLNNGLVDVITGGGFLAALPADIPISAAKGFLKKFVTELMGHFENPDLARPAIRQALRELADVI